MTGRGRLRVLLGAAPGVGKTYAMLDEGRRLADAGRDVAIAVLDTHGRAATAAMAVGLDAVPERVVTHRGVALAELDVDAVIARHPDVALVDELAHSNAPGSAHEKRWQDVAALLDAGIDVITTVNIQHIESLGDVVEQITGAVQRERVPDRFVRTADQVEVVDLAPQALRDRLSGGLVYPAERIDAALSNYFRLGNLTALRELALLWLADEVDQALNAYRVEHGIDSTWEARERVVVALPGGAEGETLLRRGARIAARAGGELVAVHVAGEDGLRAASPAALAAQRDLVEQLGGSYHQVVGADIPRSLVAFARGVNATQLVLGVSRRGRLTAALTGPGIGATVIRESGDIDVHIVTHSAAGGRFALPRLGRALSARRRLAGFVLALLGGPALTGLLVLGRSPDAVTSDVLAYQLLVVVVALIGGIWPALFAAVLSGVTLDYFFIAPFYTITIADPLHMIALLLYVVIAALVSVVVDQAARQTRAAHRSAAESELIQTVAGSVVRGQSAVQALIERAREAFSLAGVRLVDHGEVIATAGEPLADGAHTAIPVADGVSLELHGADLPASERRLLAVIAAQLAAAVQNWRLADAARKIEPIAASDRVRGALLAALGHDLRRPLAAATAAVGGLRSAGAELSDADRRELIDTADESLTTLTALVTDLLDVSRLQAGALAIQVVPVRPAEAIAPALDELGLGPAQVELALYPADEPGLADPVLLQRVLVNLLANAMRFTPAGAVVRVATSAFADRVEIRVIDRGPGIPADRRDDVFEPFQRLGDTDNTAGLGLGLALSRGFVEAMGGTLEPEDTPGGGLTMVIALRAAAASRPETDQEQP